ncbi:MAG: UDP-2,3-diacylglucosamine diphosphatase [Muribaculaceae bacterium]|nr:UDP-2,3-diacylglucosamine diphosphatase [Muribaculaceae bacterium]
MNNQHKKTYFLSDIHLGTPHVPDKRKHEHTVVSMLERMSEDAAQIYLLGDVLDYWFEYRTVVPRGFIRFFGTLAKMADSGIKITWILGNHDIWLFDYLRDEIGIEVIDGAIIRQIDGRKFYLAHGDDLGDLLKSNFRFIRSVFRNKVCQKLYSAIHPRWTVPFAHKWSANSRHKNSEKYGMWLGDEIEPSWLFAKNYIENIDPSIECFIFGHRHLLVEKKLTDTCDFVILGDCFDLFSYAVWNGRNLTLEQFDSNNLNFHTN